MWTGKANLGAIGILDVTKCPVSTAGGQNPMLTCTMQRRWLDESDEGGESAQKENRADWNLQEGEHRMTRMNSLSGGSGLRRALLEPASLGEGKSLRSGTESDLI